MTESLNCQIRVKGHLSGRWADWFDGLEIENESNGEAVLSGYLPDQAALYGVLRRISNLGVALISLNCAECSPDETSARPSSER
jgi:hypothetical protein